MAGCRSLWVGARSRSLPERSLAEPGTGTCSAAAGNAENVVLFRLIGCRLGVVLQAGKQIHKINN